MDTPKTNAQVTQELLALVNARRDRINLNEGTSEPESDPMIRALLDELSLSGDGAPGSIDRSAPYFQSYRHDPELFRRAVTKLHDQAGEIPESLEQLFSKLLT